MNMKPIQDSGVIGSVPSLVRQLISASEVEEALLDALAIAVEQGDRDAAFTVASKLAALQDRRSAQKAPKL